MSASVDMPVLQQDKLLGRNTEAATAQTLLVAALRAMPWEDRLQLLINHLQLIIPPLLDLPDTIPDSQPLAALGLDSLRAVALQHHIEATFGLIVPITSLLAAASLATLAAELAAMLSAPSAASLPTIADSGAPFPLTVGQHALWVMQQAIPASTALHLARAFRITGPVDSPRFYQALQALVARHPMLRSTISPGTYVPHQQVHQTFPPDWQLWDASTWKAAEVTAQLAAQAQRPFDLAHGPLLRVHLFQHPITPHVLLVVHHLVADFWSLAQLLTEIGQLYTAATNTAALPVTPVATFAHYQAEQAAWLASTAAKVQAAYWIQQLRDAPATLPLPTDYPRPPLPHDSGACVPFRLDLAHSRQLQALASAQHVSMHTLLLAAFQVLLFRYTAQHDVLIGTPVVGRGRAAWADVVGYFVNLLVVRSKLRPDQPFSGLLAEVRQTMLAALAHQEYPFARLIEQLNVPREPGRAPLIQVMFVWQQHGIAQDVALAGVALGHAGEQLVLGDITLEQVAVPAPAAQFDFTLHMALLPTGQLGGTLQYNPAIFAEPTAKQLVGHFQALLSSVAAEPTQPIGQLALLSLDERRQLLSEWNATLRDYTQTPIHRRILAQAERTPNATAVVSDQESLTYQELVLRANRLANYLQTLGIAPEKRVGVHLERSSNLVVALLAVWLAGGAYVPIEPGWPAERRAWLIDNAGVLVVLTERRLAENKPMAAGVVVLALDELEALLQAQAPTAPHDKTVPDNLAYVLYTSGSTGTPKGVMNTHRGICNRLLWMQEAYQLTPSDRVLQKTPFSFDVSIWEFFWPLLAGACLVVAKPEGHKDTVYLTRTIAAHQVTVLHFVPSMLQLFLGARDLAQCACLKQVFCSGEALSVDLQRQFFSRLNAELHNLYGPTEAAIDVTYWQCQHNEPRGSVPIGRPIANTEVFVLDNQLALVPVGVTGELYLGGVGLARGYLGQPDRTATAFVPNPFARVVGARLYRTGDLARWHADGALEFVGRADGQVKIRGIRIELGEIEAVLARHPAVQSAVVVAQPDPSASLRLVAYVVPRSASTIDDQGDNDPDHCIANDLRRFLREQLPEAMLPSAIEVLNRLPLTTSGKIDRRALPPPRQPQGNNRTSGAKPYTPIEQVLAAIWEEVLHIQHVGIDDNFFDAGGHSLLMAHVQSLLHTQFERDIAMLDLFKYPTIRSLAEFLSQEAAVPKLALIDARFDQLTSGKGRREEQLRRRRAASGG